MVLHDVGLTNMEAPTAFESIQFKLRAWKLQIYHPLQSLNPIIMLNLFRLLINYKHVANDSSAELTWSVRSHFMPLLVNCLDGAFNASDTDEYAL